MFIGTNAVCESKLDLLTIMFENLQMSKEETFNDFNGKLCEIDNELFALEENILKEKLVKKA